MKQDKLQKQAILFGGTDGHGATMTVISENNLRREGYEVTTVCEYVNVPRGIDKIQKKDLLTYYGTGNPEFFWGATFLNFDFAHLQRGDSVVVVDIPLPLQLSLAFSAADDAIVKIKDLCNNEISVVLIDHHKRAITHYDKAIKAGAKVVFTIGAEQYCHYGDPNNHSLFWGAIGAVCDRDTTMLPVEDDEFPQFEEREKYATWIDNEKRDLPALLEKIKKDDRKIPEIAPGSKNPHTYFAVGKVSYIETMERDTGFKQLDAACAANNTDYGVGITYNHSAILVINYWKNPSIPVALQLPHYRETAGHDTGLFIHLDTSGFDKAKKLMQKIITVLNSERIEFENVPALPLSSEADAVDYVARLFKKIPIAYYLTTHGWNHVETVLANARLLGAVSDVPDDEQKLLNWSALLHDIGNGAMEYDLDATSPEEAREHHHLYTVAIIRRWEKEGLFNHIIAKDDLNVICELCEKHRKKSDLPTNSRDAKLCSLLRIADALDKTKARARVNDEGDRYSDLKEKIGKKDGGVAIQHWKAQRAIDSIRLHLDQDHIIFEFLVTDKDEAKFIIDDFRDELTPLASVIPRNEIKITEVPTIQS